VKIVKIGHLFCTTAPFFPNSPKSCFTMLFNRADTPQNCPWACADLNPHLIHDFFRPPKSTFQTASRSVQPLYFTMGRPFLPQNSLSLSYAASGVWTPSNTRFLGPTQVNIPNNISIAIAVFTGSRSWQTERPRYSLCNNRPHLCSIAMGPNNNQAYSEYKHSLTFRVRPYLRFLNFRNFNGQNAQERQTASLCRISWRSVKQLRRYGGFSIFQDDKSSF